ncbi:MAG: SusC/RagA family TonB-linked outer membrane protein [Bacteroidales bacterium]|nr:SusC/RagA family TonB-linked outer membrane protein [Bacteroidales bacterium]
MKKIILLTLTVIISISALFAQQRVTGRVTSGEDGSALAFVTVVVTGTTVTAQTNLNGEYAINVPAGNNSLTFSFIGLKTVDVEINGRKVIDVVMVQDAVALEDVIVVAYGTAKKETFTGSATMISRKDIQQRQVSNLSNALSGVAAGVQAISTTGQPGSSATIRIRGFGSMSASNAPLYVVDGIPFDGSINSINPNDIESMTVLKDAAASAIYGHRGANGVIIITTRKGTSSDALITFEGRWGNNSRAVPNYNVMDDPDMYYETLYKALYNSRALIGQTPALAHTYANNTLFDRTGYQIYSIPEGQYLIGTNGKINPHATLGYSDGEFFYTPDNWFDELFDKGNIRQEYNVTISGRQEKINYFMSAGYLNDGGIVDGSAFSRYTARVKAEYQAKTWLKVGGNMAYANSNSKAPGGQTDWGSSGNLFYASSMIAPIYPMYVRDAQGNIMVDSNGYTIYDYGTLNSSNQVRSFLSMSNPAIELILDKHDSFTDNIDGKWYAIVEPVKGLTLTANFGVLARNIRSNNLYNPYYGSSASAGGQVTVSHSRLTTVNQQYLAAYKNTFNRHTIDLLAGYESYSYKYQYLYGWNKKIYNPTVGELDNAIYGQNPSPVASSYTNYYSLEGLLARAQYDFDEKYFASISYRRDASSRFAPENRWGNFGSIGGGWLLNKEDFMSGISWIDILKLKVSYGIQGNDGLPNYYPYLDQYSVSNSNGDFAVSMSYKGNYDITWEKSKSFNTGIEFGLFNERLNGGIEFFDRTSSDLLYNLPVAPSNGYSSFPMNVGKIRNRGVEVELRANIIDTKDIQWSVTANATSYKNTILELHESKVKDGIKGSRFIYEIGGSLYDSYYKEYAGVSAETGQAQYWKDIKDDDGNVTGKELTTDYSKATQYNNGTTLPKLQGGLGTTFNAYGIDFSMQLGYQLGGKIYDFGYEELMHNGQSSMGGTNWHYDILNAWTPENTNTDVPRLNAGEDTYQQNSTRYLVSSNYLSVNNITLGYTLPKRWTEKIKIASLRIYASGDNIWVFSKRQGLDPRQDFGGTEWSGSFIYSALRSVSGGLSISF